MPGSKPKTTPELDLPIKSFKTEDAFSKWLDANHAKSRGIWLRIAKKDSGIASVNYAQALDVALCYGWIDGQKRPCDESTWLQRFTPRGPRSVWSKINTGKVQTLIDDGRMRSAGLAAIESAKADGRWESAYQPSSAAEVPPDLQAALDANRKAKEFFATLRGANRYAVIYRVTTAKQPETRARRITEYVDRLARGETLHGVAKKAAAKKSR
jgi:uncharacterized protein YdeI (YjbR/CyaY-like superfamily)